MGKLKIQISLNLLIFYYKIFKISLLALAMSHDNFHPGVHSTQHTVGDGQINFLPV